MSVRPDSYRVDTSLLVSHQEACTEFVEVTRYRHYIYQRRLSKFSIQSRPKVGLTRTEKLLILSRLRNDFVVSY